jgi:hypothetical protein
MLYRRNEIQGLFSLNRKNLEIEARIGRYARTGGFTAGVKPYIFNQIRDQLLLTTTYPRYLNHNPTFNREDTDTYVLSREKNDTRAISSIVPAEASMPDFTFIEKKRLALVEVPEYGVRFSASSELESPLTSEELKNFIFKLGANVRRRERLSVVYTDKVFSGLRVDMTKVTYWGSEQQEYQIEIEADSKVGMTQFVDLVEFVLKLNQGSHILMSNQVRFAVGKQYNTLMNYRLPPQKRGGDPYNLVREYSNPVDITFKDMMVEEPRPYTVSIKADGKRMRLLINRRSVYLVDPPHSVGLQYMNLFDNSDLDDTILEGEYVYKRDGSAVFLVYDCLILKGKAIGDIPDHMQRHKLAESVVKSFDTNLRLTAGTPIFRCQLKEIVPGNPFESYKAAKYILSRRSVYGFEDDGLIYTPQHLTYASTLGGKIKKWKPSEKLTIDFAVKLVEGEVYSLFLVDRGNFVPFEDMTAEIPLEGGLEDGSVVEMRWVDDRFEMTRLRTDKENPNAIRTARNVWKAIQDPIPESEVIGEGLRLMRKWHLLIKKYWIGAFGKGATLLDVGSGQGGDIVSWKANQDTVYAVEPNKDNMKELLRRLDYYSFKKATVLNLGAEETSAISEATSGVEINGVALFSVLTYFFEKKSKLQGLVNTISEVLKGGGKVHGLVLDGNKVAVNLRKYGSINTPPYSITPTGEIPEKIEYGVEITINMRGTMVVNQTEYLVNYDLFRDMMVEAGFVETHSDIVTPPPYLNKYGAILSHMHRTFAFEKAGGPELELGDGSCPVRVVVEPLKMEKVEAVCLQGVPGKMVRIGVIGDGSCFIHSILRSFSSVYTKKSKADRGAYACMVRSAISMYLTPEIYEKLPETVKRKYSYSEYEEKIETCKSWQGWESAYLYRLYFQKNIYIYRDASGLVPLEMSGTCGGGYKESVVLYFVSDKHYELVGMRVGNKIKTVFIEGEDAFISDVHGGSCKR